MIMVSATLSQADKRGAWGRAGQINPRASGPSP
jgi:hypothetical protein